MTLANPPGRWVVRLLRAVAALTLATTVAGCIHMGASPGSARRGAPPTEDERLMTLLEQMTLEQKVGQLVMAGFPGKQAGREAAMLVRDYHVGGVILFGYNVEDPVQIAGLTNSLQALAAGSGAPVPLFVAADQEGGTVVRINRGATVFPGNMALGAAGADRWAYEAGRITGLELRAVGINMNFAPVVDVNNNPANPVIGIRSYGEDPASVGRLAGAYLRGLQEQNVSATAKHFPGHGDTDVDSHIDLPTVAHDRRRLDAVELAPFRAAIAAGVDAIMTAHVTFPAIDPTPGMPATLSRRVLTDLLRREMAFEGLIVTDAMEMSAITNYFGLEQAAVMAVRAGADMVLVASPRDWFDAVRTVEALIEAVREGALSEERINDSVLRILRHKERRGILSDYQVDPARVAALVGEPASLATALDASRHAITVVKNEGGLLPLRPAAVGRVLVVTPRQRELSAAEERGASHTTLGHAVRSRTEAVEEVLVGVSPTAEERRQVLQAARRADTVIIGTLRATAHPGQAALVQDLLQLGKSLVVVSLREPYDLARFPDVPVYVAAYGPAPVNIQALVEILFGEHPARGRLPVTIPGLFPRGHGLEPGRR